MKQITILLFVLAFIGVKAQNRTPVEFQRASNYFVKNTYRDAPLKVLKFTDAKKFKAVFGMATVMGKNGAPTPIDFSKQMVIAIIGSTTDAPTEFLPEKLEKNTKRMLFFEFETKIGEKSTAQFRPALLILVDKAYAPYKLQFSTHAVK
ncbi:MAG: hypothetical protein U0T73_10570 [Chitinophagales bacterium]